MNIFLQGASGIGKSYLLRKALAPYMRAVSGFVVQRLTENGVNIGFRAVMLDGGFPAEEIPYAAGLTGIFILHGQRNIAALEDTILRIEVELRDTGHKLILLDEIGGVELSSAIFMGALKRILSSGTPCAGVFKSSENLARAASNLDLEQGYFAIHRELEAFLRAAGELITVTAENRSEIEKYFTGRLRTMMGDVDQ